MPNGSKKSFKKITSARGWVILYVMPELGYQLTYLVLINKKKKKSSLTNIVVFMGF